MKGYAEGKVEGEEKEKKVMETESARLRERNIKKSRK
jgi:hypothetical protein